MASGTTRWQRAALDLEVDPGLDLNFVKMPLAGSLLAAATSYNTDVSVILNSDVMLTQSFADAVIKVRSSFEDWFLTGARTDIDELPSALDPSRAGFSEPKLCAHVARPN